jgi:hypothetical protein
MRISRFIALAAIAVVATSCSGKCEQDNAALQKRVDSLKAENDDLRKGWASVSDERDELAKRKNTIAEIALKFSLECGSSAAAVAPSGTATSVWFVYADGTRTQFSDGVAQPAELAQTAKGQYQLTLSYQPKDNADPIGQSIGSLAKISAIEVHFRTLLAQSNLHCTSISHVVVQINGLDTLQSGNIALADAPAVATAPAGDAYDAVDTRDFFREVEKTYSDILDRRLHRVP